MRGVNSDAFQASLQSAQVINAKAGAFKPDRSLGLLQQQRQVARGEKCGGMAIDHSLPERFATQKNAVVGGTCVYIGDRKSQVVEGNYGRIHRARA
jgi:hypothetical protein